MIQDFLRWLASAEQHRPLASVTVREYERQITAFARWLTDDLGIVWGASAISAHRMTSYVQYLQATLRRAPATQLKAIAALKSFGTWLVETDQLPVNPARRLRAQSEQPSAPRALDRKVVQRVIDAAYHTGDRRDAVVVELLATSGMRASEVAGIQIEDLDRGARTMWVRIVGKGAKRRRIPLPKHVSHLVDAYLNERTISEGTPVLAGPLLIGQRGGITRTTINDIVAKVVNQATLTPAQRAQVTPHAFRHTVATALVRQRDIVTAADILGHTNINTTRRYAKATAHELEDAIQAINGSRSADQ
jgi:site-specific recombinase XerD